MKPGRPEILILTRDFALAHATALAAPETWTEWHETASAALFAIGPETRVLVCDADMDHPFGRLLPTLFVDQQPGRRALVVQRSGEPITEWPDDRVTYLVGEVTAAEIAERLSREPAPSEAAA